jgi:hypothetical protein
MMTGLEFMARLAAIICPPRYPLVRFAGVLAPRSKWRREVVPKPREKQPERCTLANDGGKPDVPAPKPKVDGGDKGSLSAQPAASREPEERTRIGGHSQDPLTAPIAALSPGDVITLAPNVIGVKHWDRLMGGLLYAAQPRVDWATLLRRSLSVDVLECPTCHGRLRVVAVITEREPIQRILTHLGMPTVPPPVARARDPDDKPAQLELDIA